MVGWAVSMHQQCTCGAFTAAHAFTYRQQRLAYSKIQQRSKTHMVSCFMAIQVVFLPGMSNGRVPSLTDPVGHTNQQAK